MKNVMNIAALALASVMSFGASAAAHLVNADEAQNMQAMGSVSVTEITGAPMDIRQALAEKATKEGASAWRVTELTQGDHWHATAELYK